MSGTIPVLALLRDRSLVIKFSKVRTPHLKRSI